ncbi:Armadillo-like helical domain and Armadillo-type fold domain-containing protein [Strongyloides ratti]|uniref:Armadillo-like helical domain and Armadillo-type fold domain-containing protein n=1 Tax=Strongyloides ratti TaxID=34506 RepID=A0A090LPT0_STRRB|nr:Armadillo-like helical domain and Armadillo-type fold domain-containing protein [Strongyloides ratti]CEF70179.2 Armadillo-like helical domain and Armadillo-type fold domain-containing protein [Strongyloides ratti]
MYPILFNIDVTEVLTNSLLSNYTMAPLKDEIVTGFFVVDILKIISQLLVLVNGSANKDNYIWMIPIIIPLISSRLLRIGFIKILKTIKTLKIIINDKDLIQQIDILEMLNDPGTSNIGFETFDKRLDGYDLLKKFDETKKLLNKDIFKSLLLVNDFFITKNTDLSCNQSAEYSLSDLLIHLASSSYTEEYKKEILALYESLISRRVRAKQEDVRNSYIKILSTYVTSFQNGYKFSPLYALKTLAPDFDFFEEIVSIQLNIKQKAFTLLTDWIRKNGSMLNEVIFYQIIVPIAKPYMDDIHKDKTTLSDEAIKLFGAVIEHTKWNKFNFVINGLIGRLLKTTENVQVRLLVKQLNVCLDGFKTDLRNIKEEEALFDTSLERKRRNDEMDDVVIHDTIEDINTCEEEESLENMDVTEDETINENITNYNESLKIVRQFELFTIPKLVSIINCDNLNIKKNTSDGKRVYMEDYYILRAPIVLPLVRVLIKMPEYVIKKYKHGVVSKLCSLLICHTPEIREKARKIMVDVSLTFGPSYLSFIIYEISRLLKKGFQAHVGIYTIHTILISQKNLKPGDLDKCYKLLIDNCFLDQFGVVAEEKEVQQIIIKCPEAKENKSKYIYRILGQNCNIDAFEYFEMMSLNQLNETPDSETFRKIYSNCESLAHGSAKNICISPSDMMKYALSIFDKHLENCLKKNNSQNDEDEWANRRPRDCYLLEAEPKRLGQMAKTAQKSRNTVFIALALQLAAGTLEKKKLDSSKEENLKMIEKFVPILLKCMELRSDKLQNYSLNCILNLFNNFDLPVLYNHMNDFLNQLFVILKNVSGVTSTNNDLKQKLFVAFKLFVGNKKPVSFSDKQIKILFANIKIEMFSQSVQANAMNILKEVVKSKIGYDQIGEIMEFCISQAIQSTMEKLRDATRNVIKVYVKHNPKIDHSKLMSFVMDQFQYSLPHDYLDNSTWDKEGLTCFIRLSLLFDDDNDEVQNYARLTMVNLFEKSSGSVQSDIMEGIMKLISSKKIQIFLSGMKGLVSISRSSCSKNIPKELLDNFMRIIKIKFANASTIFTDKYFEVFIQEFFMFFERMHSHYEIKDVFDNEFLEILLNITISVENEHIIQNVYKLFFIYFNLNQLESNCYEKFFEGIHFQCQSYTFNLKIVNVIAKNLVLLISKSNDDNFKTKIIKLLDDIGKEDLKTPTTTFTKRCLTLLVLQHLIIIKENISDKEMEWNRMLFDTLFHFIYRHDVIKKSGSLDVLPTHQSEVIKDFEELVNVNIKKFSSLLGGEYTTRLGIIKNQLENKRLERKKAKFEERIRDPQRAAEKKISNKQKQMEREKLKRKRVQELKSAGVYEHKKKKKKSVQISFIE